MKYVIYTHTDYIDVAKVHADNLKFNENILLINSNSDDLEYLYSKFERVIFYDDKLPYASRLLTSINQIDSDWILLIHDMDILFNVYKSFIYKILDYAKENNIQRIDLKHGFEKVDENSIIIETDNFNKISNNEINNYSTSMVRSYLYNVNPSLWNRNALLDVLNEFSNESYRSIENSRVTKYMEKYNMYILYTNTIINSGYYNVAPEFLFIHISYHGGMMPPICETANKDIMIKWREILSNYTFNRPIRNNMYY
jgi:hypothetical protein